MNKQYGNTDYALAQGLPSRGRPHEQTPQEITRSRLLRQLTPPTLTARQVSTHLTSFTTSGCPNWQPDIHPPDVGRFLQFGHSSWRVYFTRS